MLPLKWKDVRHNRQLWEQFIRWLINALDEKYHSPTHGNYRNPANELFYIILSKKTNPVNYRPIFKKVVAKFRPWDTLLESDGTELEQLLHPLGMSRVRSAQIREIARRLKTEFGKVTLSPLREFSTDRARTYLLQMPGVGEKSARCVLMYSLGRDISPMDTHAIRILHRLGLLPDTDPTRSHRVVDKRLPDGLAYSLHVNLVAHGKAVCKSRTPDCENCCICEACFSVGRSKK